MRELTTPNGSARLLPNTSQAPIGENDRDQSGVEGKVTDFYSEAGIAGLGRFGGEIKGNLKINLRGDRLGIFEHSDKMSGQRMGQFFQGIIDNTIWLREALREKVYRNTSFLRHVAQLRHDELSRYEMILLRNTPVTLFPKESFGQDKAADFRAFSLLVDELLKILDVDPEEKRSQTRPNDIPHAIRGIANIYAPHVQHLHGRRVLPRKYDFEDPAFIYFEVPDLQNGHKIRFMFFPLPYARYRKGELIVQSLNDVMPEEAREIMYERARDLRQAPDIEARLEDTRRTLQVPSLEISLWRDNETVSTLRGEVHAIADGNYVRYMLELKAKGFPDINSSYAVGRRDRKSSNGPFKPPLQRIVEDFRGLGLSKRRMR